MGNANSLTSTDKKKPSTSRLGPWLINFLLCLGFIFLIVKSIAVASTSSFSFDGGMNVQAAQSLLRNFTFATSYGTPVEFDPVVQTGITVILPVAVIFFLFGESFTAGLMVNALYLVLMMGALVYYLWKCLKLKRSFVLLAVLLFLGIPRIYDLGFGLYGEIPMLFYVLVTLIFLHRSENSSKLTSIFLAGIFLGLGYLTKTVVLIVVPALVFVSLYDLFVKQRIPFWGYVRRGIYFCLGFLVPVAGFEIFKLISLGYPGYTAWWQTELSEILQQAGVKSGLTDTISLSEKLSNHLTLLSSYLHVPVALIVTILGTVFLFFVFVLLHGIYTYRIKKASGRDFTHLFSNNFLVVLIVTLSYYGWWLIITPTSRAYYRRILVGNILMELCLIGMASVLVVLVDKYLVRLHHNRYRWQRFFMNTLFLFLLLVSIIGIARTGNYKISFEDAQIKTDYLAAGDFIQHLPPLSEIYGYGWWQAPNIAFASGRVFKNLFFSSDLDVQEGAVAKFLVIDDYASGMDLEGSRDVLRGYEHELVFSRQDIFIYKLYSRITGNYPDFSDQEKRLVANSLIDFKVEDNSGVYTRNVFMHEKNMYGKWAQQVSGYLLKYDGEGTLRIVFVSPEMQKFESQPVTLDIFVNNELLKIYEFGEKGVQSVDVPLRHIDNSFIEVTLSCSAKMSPGYVSRELSIFMVKMELQK